MGAPTSAILAELFIQHLEDTKIIKILNEHYIIDYYRYVDDILIVYDTRSTDIDNTLTDFNSIHPQVHFTIEKETSNQLHFLDITISNRHNQLKFDIYRKPTTTDLIIHNHSCHPLEHKKSAINYLINRMNTYPITHESKDIDLRTIKTILKNNHYNQQIIHTNQKQNHNTKETQKQKWTIFTYFGTDTRTITKLFKNTNIKISFRTTNTIKKHLRPKQQITDPYNNSGVYQSNCNEVHWSNWTNFQNTI
jgi:hypothetical protein